MENAALRSVVTALFELEPSGRQIVALLLGELGAPVPGRSAHPPTIERRLRRQRAAANGQGDNAADPKAPKIKIKRVKGAVGRPKKSAQNGHEDDWPELRSRLRAAIKRRRILRHQVAQEIGCSPGSLQKYLAPNKSSRRPCAEHQSSMRAWIARRLGRPGGRSPHEQWRRARRERALASCGPGHKHTLTVSERDLLRGHLSLGDERGLRQEFGTTWETLEDAAAGQQLAVEIVDRVRSVLADGAASSG